MLESSLLVITASRRYVALLTAVHVIAAFAVITANIPSVLVAGLLLLVGASAARYRRQFFSLQVRLFADGRFAITDAEGRLMEADASCVEFTSWLILRYSQSGRTRMLVLGRDSFLSEDEYRGCRRWFRWRLSAAPA